MINRPRFTEALDKFHQAKILLIGDAMLDQYFFGSVHRISPEAPVPVLSINHTVSMLGGAGNVARNIAAQEGACTFFTLIGGDSTGHHLSALIEQEERIVPYITVDHKRITTSKTRYVAEAQHILRTDYEYPDFMRKEQLQSMLRSLMPEIESHDVIVLSDYRKGIFTPEACRQIMEELVDLGKIVIVDSKARDFRAFAGATFVTPNVLELSLLTGRECRNEADINAAAKALRKRCDIEYVLVTRGMEGMMLVGPNATHCIPANAHSVYDVSGAGDTVVATLALGIAAGLSPSEAAYLANMAAGIAVSRLGTSAVSMQDLRLALLTDEKVGGAHKIVTQDVLLQQADYWMRAGNRIGFTNGCFDILHAGHLQLLNAARAQCDKLIVGLNSDASVRALKGDGRPVHDEMQRALMLSALSCVDAVVIFEDETPKELIRALRPDVLIKGDDYAKSDIAGADLVEAAGGRVVILPRVPGYSTSSIIDRMKGLELVVSH